MTDHDEIRKQAWITSLRLLAATPKTQKELSGKLLDKGYPQEIVAGVLADLQKQGILNDQAYAQNLAQRLRLGRPSGKRKIAFELKRHGISSQLQEEVLSGIGAEEERASAKEIGLEKWERFKNFPAEKRERRVYDFLVRRGFDFQMVRDLIREFSRSESKTGSEEWND